MRKFRALVVNLMNDDVTNIHSLAEIRGIKPFLGKKNEKSGENFRRRPPIKVANLWRFFLHSCGEYVTEGFIKVCIKLLLFCLFFFFINIKLSKIVNWDNAVGPNQVCERF